MKSFLITVFFIISHTSFTQNNSIDNNDFVKLECGLYKSNSGEIGFKTLFLIDDKGTQNIRYQSKGYIIDQKSNDFLVNLKDVIDIASFEILNDYYCKDKNYIYAIFYTSDGAIFNITKKINPSDFKTIANSCYGIDNKKVYFRTEILKKANLKTFEVIENKSNFAFDKNNYYHDGQIITAKEAKEFGIYKSN